MTDGVLRTVSVSLVEEVDFAIDGLGERRGQSFPLVFRCRRDPADALPVYQVVALGDSHRPDVRRLVFGAARRIVEQVTPPKRITEGSFENGRPKVDVSPQGMGPLPAPGALCAKPA